MNGEPFCRPADGTPEGCVCKNVFGTYLAEYRQAQFDLLADGVRKALDMGAVYRAMGMKAP